MTKAKKKSAKEASNIFHNIIKASVSKPMAKKIESVETEIDLPDGTKAFVLETEWRGHKRYFFDTVSKKYPSFSVTLMQDKSHEDSLTFEQATLLNFFLRGKK